MSGLDDRVARRTASATIVAGGIALVAGALAFLGVFSYLAATFQYPEILDGRAQDVLPALLATGTAGRVVWAFYGVLPLVFIPAGVGAFEALRARSEGPMRIAMLFAFLSGLSMTLGLLRWPSVNWRLAQTWSASGEDERLVLAAVFDGLNLYLGNFVGEFIGELSFSIFFLLSGVALVQRVRGPRWLGWWGITTGVFGVIGMWRNVTHSVNAVASVNNYLLPAWMIGFGVWLIVVARHTTAPGEP